MSEITVAELVRVANDVESQGLSTLVLAAQRLRRGKRLPPPKRVGGSLPVRAIGGRELDWYVALEIADVRAFAKRHAPDRTVPLRVVQPAEKLSPTLRRWCNMDDPPADPWGDSWPVSRRADPAGGTPWPASGAGSAAGRATTGRRWSSRWTSSRRPFTTPTAPVATASARSGA